jgi:hypothetical protein
VFKRAIKAHGVTAFTREILFYSWCTRRELLGVEEQVLIDLDARGDKASYNTKNKGLGQDPEVTRAIFLGKKKPRDQVERQRAALLASGAVRGENNARARAVVCLDTGDIYPYARAAAKAIEGHEVGVSEACNTGSQHRGMFWMFLDEWEGLGRPECNPRTDQSHAEAIKVVRLTDGKVYESASEAAREFNVSSVSISLALESLHRSSAGHHWQKLTEWEASGRNLKPLSLYDRSAGSVIDSKTGVVYASAADCARDVGLSDVAVGNQTRGKTKERRFFFLTEWETTGGAPASLKNEREIKRVRRVDTGEDFPTMSAAAASIDGKVTGLSMALQGSRPYRGIVFEYA